MKTSRAILRLNWVFPKLLSDRSHREGYTNHIEKSIPHNINSKVIMKLSLEVPWVRSARKWKDIWNNGLCLCVPVSYVSCERVFTLAGNIVSTENIPIPRICRHTHICKRKCLENLIKSVLNINLCNSRDTKRQCVLWEIIPLKTNKCKALKILKTTKDESVVFTFLFVVVSLYTEPVDSVTK